MAVQEIHSLFSGRNTGVNPGFEVGGGLKIIALIGATHENFGGISCEKSRFYVPPPLDPPLEY